MSLLKRCCWHLKLDWGEGKYRWERQVLEIRIISVSSTAGYIHVSCGCLAKRSWEFHFYTQNHSVLHSFQTHLNSTHIPASCFHHHHHFQHHHRSFPLQELNQNWKSYTEISVCSGCTIKNYTDFCMHVLKCELNPIFKQPKWVVFVETEY